MNVGRFIAARLRFDGKIAMLAIAISFFVIIIAVAISSGFRSEFRKGISRISGDISLTSPSSDYTGEEGRIRGDSTYIAALMSIDGVSEVVPAVYRAGIVKAGEAIDGALFKGVPGVGDSLGVTVPRSLADRLSLERGDPLPTYFIGERIRARKFTVKDIYDDILGDAGAFVIFAGIEDMRRLNGWGEADVSSLELILEGSYSDAGKLSAKEEEVAMRLLSLTPEDEDVPAVQSSLRKYPSIYSWLDLIDRNVLVILVLMVAVAGFNMISGLLILLFRNTSTIGILKSMGMGDWPIAGIFLRVSSRLVLRGMLAGNALALALCLLQGLTHALKLNPENYFVSFVPVHISIPLVLVADITAYLLIMLLLLIPSLFVSRVDPAKTVRAK